MSFRTNPDRILENIDRARSRAEESGGRYVREAMGRALDTELPLSGATPTERARRVFGLVEQAYTAAAQSNEFRRLASRFQAVGDIHLHHARGDVSVSIQYLDSDRRDDIGLVPFEILPEELEEARKTTKSSRPDANAFKILREDFRDGVLNAYRKVEPRVRDAVQERADWGHVAVQVTIDLRPGS